jgi:putative transposase
VKLSLLTTESGTFDVVPRKSRVQSPGYYHVGARGNDRQVIFDDVIRELFLYKLSFVASDFEWSVLGWALMSNHFHLVVQVGEQGLAAGMQRLNLFLASISNARFSRTNHCLGNRYWSEELEDEPRLHSCIRYVMWNPVRAGIVAEPCDSPWTSCRAGAGLERAHPALALDQVLALFDRGPAAAYASFAALVESGAALR